MDDEVLSYGDGDGSEDGDGHRAGGGRPHGAALPGPLVGADWLAARLGAPGLLVLDASVGANRGSARRIAGARPFDIDGALSDHSGPLPHTMPGAARFTEELRALGLDDGDTVVVYDAVGIYSSARAWWMLRAMGFDRVAVLDGGLPGWTAAGLPVESGAPGAAERGDFTARPRAGLFAGADEVAAALADPAARSSTRGPGNGSPVRLPSRARGCAAAICPARSICRSARSSGTAGCCRPPSCAPRSALWPATGSGCTSAADRASPPAC